MGDSIYTILIIAWVVYGIYSAVKKNKAKANAAAAPSPQQSQPTAVESVFESLFQERSAVAPAASHPYSEEDFEEEDFDSESMDSYQDQEEVYDYEETDYLDTVPEKYTESEIDTYSGTDSAVSSFQVDMEEEDEIKQSAIEGDGLSGEKDDLVDFDLRQAVIAQAVLDRPYE